MNIKIAYLLVRISFWDSFWVWERLFVFEGEVVSGRGIPKTEERPATTFQIECPRLVANEGAKRLHFKNFAKRRRSVAKKSTPLE